MRILIRTDANAQVGAGHLMRCLALADGLHAIGAECTFLCRAAGLGSLVERIAAGGHTLLALPEAADPACDTEGPMHTSWLPGGWFSDAIACRSLLAGMPTADWLVVDHYALDHRWQCALRDLAKKLMVVDDLADRRHDCDLLLDQNLMHAMQSRYDGLVPSKCVRLLGPRFALLRREFARCHPFVPKPTEEKLRLLVMYGGADAIDLTSRSIELLLRLRWPGFVDVVAGPLYRYRDRLTSLLAKLPHAALYAPANDVAGLMRRADVALGSPGVASWERCACGLPAVTVAQADNQEAIGIALAAAGANCYLGRAETLVDECMEEELSNLASTPERLRAMAVVAAGFCDGHGSERAAYRMRELL